MTRTVSIVCDMCGGVEEDSKQYGTYSMMTGKTGRWMTLQFIDSHANCITHGDQYDICPFCVTKLKGLLKKR